MIIDQLQREQALDWQKSFIVQAPAGSGKTELLIQRYLVLLAKVERLPEQVIAITFTRKAALEMRNRVIEALTRAEYSEKPQALHQQTTWILAREVLQRDKRENWQLLQQPNRLNMLTIDSFCASLSRQLPLVSGFGAMPEIAENPWELYQQAAEQVWLSLILQKKWQKPIRNLLWHFDNQLPRLQRLIAELLSRREQWLDYIYAANNAEQITEILQKHLHHLINDVLDEASEKFPKPLQNTCIDLLSFAANQCAQHQIKNEILLNCININALPETHAENLLQWKAISHFLLTLEGTPRKRIDRNLGFLPKTEGKTAEEKNELQACKEYMLKLLQDLSDYPELIKKLQHIQQLPPAHYAVAQQQVLVDLLEVLALSAAELMVLFQQKGTCDFNQLLQGALNALGTADQPTDLALNLDYRIQHILVDEFQDTSVAQFRLLERLTAGWEEGDGRSLFLVGDPMQSIYRFRQAEVGLFLTAWKNGMGQIPLNPLVLQVNFRSTHSVVDWINRHMSAAFPQYGDIGLGAVPFTAATAYQQHLETNVNVYNLPDEYSEAQHIVQLIQQALADENQKKIAVLISARSHLSAILPALQTAKIDYHAIDIESLTDRPALQDLLALTRALLHPGDKIAWLAILRAPWCGLNLIELTTIVELDQENCILDNLSKINNWQDFSPHSQKVLPNFIQIMQTAIANRQRLPISQWILGVWLGLKGNVCYQETTLTKDVEKYLALLEEMDSEIYYLSPMQLEKKLEKLYATPRTAQCRVQIMTMHKAKGLEFDTVIIPGLHRMKSTSDRPLLAWWERPRCEGSAELLIAALQAVGNPDDELYQYIWRQNKQADSLETTRLLYVAMTRAKKYLHLTSIVEDNPPTNSLLNCIWPTVQQEIIAVEMDLDNSSNLANNQKQISRLIEIC